MSKPPICLCGPSFEGCMLSRCRCHTNPPTVRSEGTHARQLTSCCRNRTFYYHPPSSSARGRTDHEEDNDDEDVFRERLRTLVRVVR